MPDLLDSIQRQLRERLDELRPLVSEYERLRDAEHALTGDNAAAPPPTGESRRGRAVGRRRSRARTTDPGQREANREKVLALVAERPGITKTELQTAAGLSAAGAAQNLRRLVDRGLVATTPLPGGQTGYRRAETTGESGDRAA